MQEGLHASPTWLQIALGALASFLAGGGIFKALDTWLNRKKPAADIHVQEATATEIIIRSNSTAGDAVIRMMTRLDEAQSTIDRLRQERDAWEDQYDDVFVQRDGLIRQNSMLTSEVNGYEEQLKRMHRTLQEHQLNYDGTQDKPVTDSPE